MARRKEQVWLDIIALHNVQWTPECGSSIVTRVRIRGLYAGYLEKPSLV